MAVGQPIGQHAPPTNEDLRLLLDFLNTLDVAQGVDVLDAEATWRTWVSERGLGVTGELGRIQVVRNALRATVGEHQATVAEAGTIQVDLRDGLPRLVAADAVGKVLAAAVRVALLGEWDRIKICLAEDCRWVFYDRSRNRSRTWCSMQVCGNREKARNWRERARAIALA